MPAGAWLHVDPDRRPDDKRASSPEYCQPAVTTIDRLLAGAAGGAVKLAPAAEVPAHWHESLADREWISRGGSCRQQVAWFLPTYGPQRRRATAVHGTGQSVTFSVLQRDLDDLRSDETDGPGRWLVDFDPAVRAAGLSHALGNHLGLAAVGGPAGFFTCDEPPRGGEMQGVERGLFTPFRVLWQGAMDQKSLRRRIREYDPPSLEIKVRGAGIRPEALRERLLKPGAAKPKPGDRAELVLLVGRRGHRNTTYAAIAERSWPEWRV